MNATYLRSLIESLDNLDESTGLAGRATGAVFKNKNNDEIYFNELKFYPENGGKFTPEELEIALQDFNDVKWMNEKTSKSGGFGIATFTDSSNNIILTAGIFKDKISPNFRKNYIPNEVFGYLLDTKASKKSKEPLKPQDLLSKKKDLTAISIVEQLKTSLGSDSVLYKVAFDLANGSPLPYTFNKPENFTFSGFRDYFCEILQPIALQMGQYTGNAGEAAEKFLNGSFKKTVISFDESVTAGLSDSIMTTQDGKYVLISTKGGAGAKASAKNLYDKILQLEQTESGAKFLQEYQEEVDIIKNIVKFGQNGSPLYLGVKFNVIDNDEANQVKMLRNQPLVNIADIDDMDNLSDRLKNFIKNRKTKTPENTDLYYHLMAAIAEKAAAKVNDSTNFSKAASDILNNAGLIQVYTKAKEKGNQWVLEEFNTVYPSDTIRGVHLDSSKPYYSTDIKGNFTFLIDKGSGVKNLKQDDQEDLSTPVDVSYQQRQKRAAPTVTKVFRTKEKSDDAVGRKKR